MEPSALGLAEWSELGLLLRNLWLVLIFVVFFAANMLVGHNFIPSFVASDHIPRKFQKVRPFFYALAAGSFALAVFFFVRVVDHAGVLEIFWPNYYI